MDVEIGKTLAGFGRRGFLGRLAAGSATVLAGAGKFAPVVSAHEEKLTMSAALAGRSHGISSYVVRRSGSNTDTHRTVAELWDATGAKIGEYIRTDRLRTEIDDRMDAADPKGERQNRVKQFRVSRHEVLVWANHTLETKVTHAESMFQMIFDGVELGTLDLKTFHGPPEQRSRNQYVEAFVAQHSELLLITDAVAGDLKKGLAPRETLGCCCQFYCGAFNHTCSEYGNTLTAACAAGESCVNLKCWNSLCAGCCNSNCNTVCIAGDFICYAYVDGDSCGCSQYCV